jgi:hypothetical protein
MKAFEIFFLTVLALCAMAGMWAVWIFEWMPDPKITATIAFMALMFAASARARQARDRVEPIEH